MDWHSSNGTPEIQVTSCYAEIDYTPNERTCYLTNPEEISTDHTRNAKMLNFWNGNREVYDYNRSSKSMVLKGIEYYDANSNPTPCDRILCMRNMGKNGAEVTISGLNPTYFNGIYRIRQFGWNKVSEKPELYKWILELEDAEA